MSFGVTNRGTESVDSMLKRFKKKQKNHNFIDEVNRTKHYISPSEKKNSIKQKQKFIKRKTELEREKHNIRI